jgi:hypothetical protein
MKRLLLLSFFLLSLSHQAGNSDKEKKAAKVIAGRVTDQSGQNVAGAKICVIETGETFYADLEGRFQLTVKSDKTYSIQVNTIGYVPAQYKSTELSAFSQLSLEEL